VLEAMAGAISDADRLASEHVWLALNDLATGIDIGAAASGALGRRVASVSVLPGGVLAIEIEDGPHLRSPTWWLAADDNGRWAGSAGQVTRTEEADHVHVSPGELADLAEAWLDHD